jgi:hypothetical protein
VQRNEPKKGQPLHIGPLKKDSPHFSKINGRCETRPPMASSDSRSLRLPLALFPLIFSKFGKVIMGIPLSCLKLGRFS